MMKLWNHIKKSFQNYLTRLEKENKELFGNERPNCCTLNRREENRRR